MIIVNFKTYQNAVGPAAVELAKIHEAVAKETGVDIAIAVDALDLAKVAEVVSIPVFAQHVDAADFGSFTGGIVPEVVKALGAVGTLLNHSEKRLGEKLPACIAAAKRAGLAIILCAETAEEAEKFVEYSPEYIAVEPPELIGGDISVTSANPAIIEESVKRCGDCQLLVGAGVKNGKDVATAMKLGAKGVLLASGVTKAANPAEVLRDLASGLKV
ncbi:MAG: triose-phosphate isomerase [Candidatus Gracilibacteria bacterium]|jgi:triosephosphate isomerase